MWLTLALRVSLALREVPTQGHGLSLGLFIMFGAEVPFKGGFSLDAVNATAQHTLQELGQTASPGF